MISNSIGCSFSFFVDTVLEWDDRLGPSWMVSRDDFHGVNFSKLNNVQNFKFFQLQESIKNTIVELAEESHGVSARQVFLLGIVNGHLDVKIRLLVSSDRIWNFRQELVIVSSNEFFLKLSKFSWFIESLRSVRVKMSETIEVLRSKRLSSSITHIRSVERVVNDLDGLPVTFCLQKLIHDFLRWIVAIGHDPSVEANEPNLFQENFDFTWRMLILVKHVWNLFNAYSFASFTTFSSSCLMVFNNSIDESSKVLTNWKINKNFLEENNKLFTSKTSYWFESLKLSERIHGCLDDFRIEISSDSRDVRDNILNLVAVHHELQEWG